MATKKIEKEVEIVETIDAVIAPKTVSKAVKKTAKAGKRSVKGVGEAEAKVEKIEKQVHKAEIEAAEAEAPKIIVVKARTKLERSGKKMRQKTRVRP